MNDDPTPPLDEFLPRYDADDNVWWAMDSGHHMNLFDEAVDRMQAAEARLAALTDAIGNPAWLEWWTGALADIPRTLKIRLAALAAAVQGPGV
jgi:transposase